MNANGGTLVPGTLVRIAAPQAGLTLASRIGIVVRVDPDDDDYYVIRLLRPALYDRGLGGPPERLREIVEMVDNLRPMVAAGSNRTAVRQRKNLAASKKAAVVRQPGRQIRRRRAS